MPLWAQPNLAARDPARGGVFQNICFFGDPENLAPELRDPAWLKHLEQTGGLRLDIRRADRWSDYSDVDCALAIRDFSKSTHLHKPATKLYNAWIAGVPFIGGMDSAYAADGRPGVDFLQAASPDAVLAHLRRLRNDPAFRNLLVANGRESGKAFTREATCRRWEQLATKTLPEKAGRWMSAPKPLRLIAGATRRAVFALDRRIR